MKIVLSFIKDLRANNNREWFQANRQRYLDVKERVDEVATALIDGVAGFEPEAKALRPSDCTYRIYRDTRFSADKTPYKNHIGIYVNPHGGKKSAAAGYYLHLEPGNCLVAGGMWCPSTPLLKAVRKDIYDNVEEYIDIISDPSFCRFFPQVGEDLLKTAPKGFPKDWPHIDLLRPRSFTAMGAIPEDVLCSPDALPTVFERFRALKPFNAFLNFTFEENPDLLFP